MTINNATWLSGEKMLDIRLTNGLRVVVLPKKGFFRKAVTLIIPFGSEDENIECQDEKMSFPAGSAHLLEHLLFESQDGFYTRKFTEIGSTANAYTTNNRTAIYFSTVGAIDEPLKLLFEMLENVDFRKDAINKEKKIVSEEISLYDDDVEQSLYFDLMRSLYRSNPVKNDIAGSKESLRTISAGTLEKAFSCFYRYQNMILVIAGDVDKEAIITLLENLASDNVLVNDHFKRIRKIDPEGLAREYYTEKRDLRNSIVMMGIKLENSVLRTPMEAALEEIKGYLFLENYMGKMSGRELELQKQGLVNDTFDFSLSVTTNYGHIILYSETKKPEETMEAFRNLFALTREHIVKPDDLERQKRKMIGDFVLAFDSVSRSCSLLSEYLARGADIFVIMDAINRMTPKDLQETGNKYALMPQAFVHYGVR
ncbi:MAG TPA: pitrilysin family protein [Bacillota bacterium]|nr:pitrilysin family protein [Bacillota bacterium]HPJ85679.1 pitrilysin family protein [Bacillota bacterium]